MMRLLFVVVAWCALAALDCGSLHAQWARHTIDNSSRGADGVKSRDINSDYRQDLVVGWEEGGIIRVYLQPEVNAVTEPWPAVTVGEVESPEDALLVDLEQDGVYEVVSCCEGEAKGLFLHRCFDPDRMLEPAAWATSPIDLGLPARQWMFAELWPVAGTDIRIVAGAKGDNAELGVLTFRPDQPADEIWSWQPLQPAGWIMSIQPCDYHGDFDLDIIFSDRSGPGRGVHWYETAGRNSDEWRRHTIGGTDHEVMFLDTADLDGDGYIEVVCAAKDAGILIFNSRLLVPEEWSCETVPLGDECGTAKGVALLDVDRDGDRDIVFSCENAENKIGVGWLESPDWELHDISGTEAGVKFDLMYPHDVNDDGWVDVVTCEEADNLGVIWYENPGEGG
jgi:hypothetical protein